MGEEKSLKGKSKQNYSFMEIHGKYNVRAFKIDGRAIRVNIKTFIFPLNAKQCRKDHLRCHKSKPQHNRFDKVQKKTRFDKGMSLSGTKLWQYLLENRIFSSLSSSQL